MANAELKAKMAYNGVKQYRVAETLGISETSMSRKLRKELSAEEKNRIMSAIEKLAENAAVETA